MANSYGASPWSIDTYSATPFYTNRFTIQGLAMVGYADADSRIELQDQTGKTICVLGKENNYKFEPGNGISVNGLLAPVNRTDGGPNGPSGRLLIYY